MPARRRSTSSSKPAASSASSWPTTAPAFRATSCRSHWRGMPPARSPAWKSWKASNRSAFAAKRWHRSLRWPTYRITSRVAGERQRVLRAQRHATAIEPAAGSIGTRVEVADLFHKTPARRKFLRSEATELAHCLTQVERAAAAHSSVAFTVTHQGRTVLALPAQAPRERALRLMPEEFAVARREVEQDAGALRVHGWAGAPTASRARADAQYFFVNGRYVRDKVLTHAVRAAYADVLHGAVAADVLPVPDDRSEAGRRQRAPDQDRSALSRFVERSPVRAARGAGRAGAIGSGHRCHRASIHRAPTRPIA